MKIMKRIIALIIALSLFISALTLSLVSCGEEEKKTPTGLSGPGKDEPITEGDIFAERAAVPDDLEAKDFGGRTFRIVTHKYDEVDIDSESINKGDLIKDAMAFRDATVEERFGVDIAVTYRGLWADVADYVAKTVSSGTDEFDLLSSHVASTGGLVVKNLFQNWYTIPHIDFSKPWWSSCCTEELTYDGKCILAVSDFNYSALWGARCLLFNKELASSYEMGDLYQTVLDGKWTIDHFTNLIKDIYLDNDSSGTKSPGDFYGFAQGREWDCAVSTWLWAFDNPTMKKTEDGVPQISVKTDKINSIVKKVYDLVYNTQGVHYENNNESKQGFGVFIDKNAIFTMTYVGQPVDERLRNFDDDYGLLPLPKWDENQKKYLTMTDGEHTVMAVPKTAKDLEFVGTICEALAAESYKQVIPTLYEIALKTRYLRDNESKEVLDIILDGRVYDFGYVYDNWQGFGFMLGIMIATQNSNFESFYQQTLSAAKSHFSKVLKAFDSLD